jgi:hypothetical protein
VQLFPKYLEKSGSKAHSQFFFGNASSERVFKDYQRLRFQKQYSNVNNQKMNDSSTFNRSDNPTHPNRTSNSFYGQGSSLGGGGNRSIFDIPMSEVNPAATDQTQLTLGE